MSDYYSILGVSKDADESTIKKAYRKLAMKYHPDKNPGNKAAEDKFKEAAEAYEVLSNKDKRGRYDQFGKAGVGGPGAGGTGFHDINDIFSSFGDIFGDFFGGGAPRGRGGRSNAFRPMKGSDLRYYMDVSLDEVKSGAEKNIQFDGEIDCDLCDGYGGIDKTTCGDCGGQGQVVHQQGFFQMARPCPKCRGRGQTFKESCHTCSSSGRVSKKRKIKVTIPKGVSDGNQLRLSGEGEGGFRKGPSGDLYVEVRVKPDKRFLREGQNLRANLTISYLQALLGAKVKVETLEGASEVTVPNGSSDGDTLRLSQKGLPSLRGEQLGDLLLDVRVKMPKKLDKEEERLLKQIADIKGENTSGKAKSKGFFKR